MEILKKLRRRLIRSSETGPSAEHYAQGTLLYRQGRYDEAAAELSQVGDGGVAGDLARFYQGMSHRAMGIECLRSGQFELCEGHFRQAMNCLGEQADLASYLSSLYAQTGRFDDCAGQVERIASAEGGAANWRKLAQAQWRSGRRAQAYMTIEQALRQFGPDAQLHLQRGLFQAAEENFAAARESLAKAAEDDCTRVDAHRYLGLVLAACNDPASAVRAFQRALQLKPCDVSLAYQLAVSARAASQQGQRVVIQLPDFAATSVNSTQVQQLARFVASEADFLEALLAMPPSDVDAELFEMLSDVVQVALADHPGYADLHYSLGRLLERLGRIEQAIEHTLQAVSINGRYVKALVQLAKLYDFTNCQAAAVEYLKQAIACGADWPDVHCLAGELMNEVNRPDEARTHLQRALQLKPSYARASEALRSMAA